MKKNLLLIIFTAAAVLWIMIIPIGVENSYMKVDAIKAASADVVNTIDCSGTLQAANKYQVTLGCQVKIKKKYFCIGDKVKKGDRLLDIDKNITLQALNYSDTDGAGKVSNKNSSSSQISSDEATSALNQALSSGIITKDTYNSLIDKINNSGDSGKSLPASGNTNISAKTETTADKLLDSIDSCLSTPISGIVTDITDGTCGLSSAGTPLAEIVDFSSIYIKAQVDESNINNVKVGQQVYITGRGFKGTYSGFVKQIYPVAENVTTSSGASNMVCVIIGINKPDENLLPGLDADVKIKTSVQRGMVTLPYDSIKQDDDGTEYVYVFKSGKAVRKNITTGNEGNVGVEIIKGVNRGDIVIENTNDTALNGRNVRIH